MPKRLLLLLCIATLRPLRAYRNQSSLSHHDLALYAESLHSTVGLTPAHQARSTIPKQALKTPSSHTNHAHLAQHRCQGLKQQLLQLRRQA